MILDENKKIIPLCVLAVLLGNTDERHPLPLSEISRILKHEYGMNCDRKTIKRAFYDLELAGYDIECVEKERASGDTHQTNWYIVHEFVDSELRLIIDSLLFSGIMTNTEKHQIIRKLGNLSTKYFRSEMNYALTYEDIQLVNPQNMYTIDVLHESISNRTQVSFIYNMHGEDMKLHPKRSERYVVNPYQLVMVNGKYYLVCNCVGHENISHFRIDRITDIFPERVKSRPSNTLVEFKHGLDLSRHISECLYMFTGDSRHISFRVDRSLIDVVVDRFGADLRIEKTDENSLYCNVKVNEQAMILWAIQYGNLVEIISPQKIRDEMRKKAAEIMEMYDEK